MKRKRTIVRSTTVGRITTEKLPTVRKAKYRVGEKVYSYENPTIKKPIAQIRALVDDAAPTNVYCLLLGYKNGVPKYGNWISELSISTVKKEPLKSKSNDQKKKITKRKAPNKKVR